MQERKKILFVCVENSFRSQIAEAFARMYGGSRITLYSAGSKPSGMVHPKAIATMKEIGYDLAAHSSKSLSDLPDVEYDVAVTMGCGDECVVDTRPSQARQDAPFPVVRAKRRESWDIPDPKNLSPEEVTAIRDLIGRQVHTLIEKELHDAQQAE
jgi:arsenate reductase (thioredoxin)